MDFGELSSAISPLSATYKAMKAINKGLQGSLALGDALGALGGAFPG